LAAGVMEGNEYGADSFNRLENYESHASVAQGAELMPESNDQNLWMALGPVT